VAVDFYDGCLIYDFAGRAIWLCDLDSYRPGPYVLDRDRQYGSARFMAPEELTKGATMSAPPSSPSAAPPSSCSAAARAASRTGTCGALATRCSRSQP
jgi:hypothetical protein